MKAFGQFRLDTVNHCLWRGDESTPLTPKAFDVLRYFVERPGRLVTQEELLDALWPETYVNPEGIRKYILEVRKVLGDPADQPAFIKTLPKRGYQFIAPVTEDRRVSGAGSAVQPSGDVVGRQRGLDRLDGCLDKALRGHRQIVFITGEAGIGKTTLVDVFENHAAQVAKLRVSRGQCIEGFGGIEAYYPMLEAFGSLLQGAEDSALLQMLIKRAPTWVIQFPSLVDPEQRKLLEREILGSSRERMVREICEAVELITADTPLMIILEDLHWVDPSTLDVISALARRREPAKLLLVGTYRPVDLVLSQSPLRGLKQNLLVHSLCHEISIECLEEPDVAEYLGRLFGSDGIPPSLPGTIHQNSGGNPLFMVAIVQDMMNKGLIQGDRGGLRLTVPVKEVYTGIPETLQQLLEIQLDQLTAEDKRVLQSGSVAGERFSVWALGAMLNAAPTTIEEQCDSLVNRQRFIRSIGIHAAPNGTLSPHYEFRHALYRQALYRSLSGVQRSELHHRLGEHLMPVWGAGKPELASELALHFEEGRDYEQATRFLMLAAENTAKRFSYRQSLQILRHALDIIPPSRPGLAIPILQRIGDAQFVLGEMSASVTSYQAAMDMAAESGLRLEQLKVLMQMTLPAWFIDIERGSRICDLALEVSKSLSDPLLSAQTEIAVACCRLLYIRWRPEDVEACARAELTIRSHAAADLPRHVYHSYVKVLQGEFEEGLRQAEAIIETTDSPNGYIRTLAFGAKGLLFFSTGRYGDMLRVVRMEKELARKNEEEVGWIWVLGEAWLCARCYDFDGVSRLRGVTMPTDVEPHAIWTKTAARISAGQNEIVKGNYDKALQCFAEVRDETLTPNFFLHWHWRIHAQIGAVEAFLGARDIASARRTADELLNSALSVSDPNLHALAWEINARISRAEQDLRAARGHIDQALAVVDRYDIPVAGWQVHRTACDVCQEEGASDKAEGHRKRAKELIMKIADSFDPDEPLRQSFLSAHTVQPVLAGKGTTTQASS
jgi:DNA-binding winged helix-turn-helix (wHTH) protein